MTVSFPQVFAGVIWAVPHHSIPCSASRPALTSSFVHMGNLLSLALLFMFKLFCASTRINIKSSTLYTLGLLSKFSLHTSSKGWKPSWKPLSDFPSLAPVFYFSYPIPDRTILKETKDFHRFRSFIFHIRESLVFMLREPEGRRLGRRQTR